MANQIPGALSPDASARLVEFVRACKTAARAVSLYPAGHPAIGTALERLTQTTGALTRAGPLRMEVTADTLLIGGSGLPRPDAGVTELAGLLNRHLIGALTINPSVTTESWRVLLLLLARPAESVRQDGGIRHLWMTAGGPSVDIQEVDYADVLRDRLGIAAAASEIIAAALAGPSLELDESGIALLLDLVESPGKLQELVSQLERVGRELGADRQAAAFLAIARRLASWLSRHDPDRLDAVFRQLGEAACRLSAGAMLAILEHQRRADPDAAANAAGLVIERMTDESIARFVAGSVVRERGATERLARAFQALVPDVDRQRRLLALAEADAAMEEGVGDLRDLWPRVEAMLTSCPDEPGISARYAEELAGARTRAIEVERVSDDPPERIAVWLASVADGALRDLDRYLMLDLLRIEPDPARWRDVAATAVAHADDLVRVGYFDQAWDLAEAVVREGRRAAGRSPHAAAALERLGRETLIRHVAAHLRSADAAAYGRVTALFAAIGPTVVPALTEALATEPHPRARQRLRDIVVAFGAEGREAVRQLMNAPGWEIRRTAASLMRELGAAGDLRELAPLLTDSEPRVRREAIHALLLAGGEEASRLLLDAVAASGGQVGQGLLPELATLRDERAAPQIRSLLRHADRRKQRQLCVAAMEALGTMGGAPEDIETLRAALYHRDWLAPIGARQVRAAAARALRRIGTPPALDALREAASRGTIGVRAAAKAQLPRPDGNAI